MNIYKDKTIKKDEKIMISTVSTACLIILSAILVLILFGIIPWEFLLNAYVLLSLLYTGLQIKITTETKFKFSKNNFISISWGWPYTGFIVIKHFALLLLKKNKPS